MDLSDSHGIFSPTGSSRSQALLEEIASGSVSAESFGSPRSLVTSNAVTDASLPLASSHAPIPFGVVNVFTDAGLAFSILRSDLGNYTAGRTVCHALADHIDFLNVPDGFDMDQFVLVENPNTQVMKILEQRICLADYEFPWDDGNEQVLYVKYLPDLEIASSSNNPSATPYTDDYFKSIDDELRRMKEELHQTQRKVAVLDGQNLALSLALYYGFHGEKTSKDSVNWEVSREYMEELYFRDRYIKETRQSNPKKFSEKEWQSVKDHWVDESNISETKGDPEDFDMAALHIMFFAIGVPVHVIFDDSPNGLYQLHLRIPVGYQEGFAHEITLGQVKDLVWEKWGEEWMRGNGWTMTEMHFGYLTCKYLEDYDSEDYRRFPGDGDWDDDYVIGGILSQLEGGIALEMHLVPNYYEITSDEGSEIATSIASSVGRETVNVLVQRIGIPPEVTSEHSFYLDSSIFQIKHSITLPLDNIYADDIRILFKNYELDDNMTLRECEIVEGSTITVVGRFRGGGASKRRIEERQDETWRVATKAMKEMKPDNQFILVLQNLVQHVSNNVPIFENGIQQMQYEPIRQLQNAWFECPQTQAERVMEQIWHHLDASYKAIHKAEEDAKMIKKCIIPLLTYAYMKEFPDGARGSCDHDTFETMLNDRVRDLEKEIEVNRRVAEQLKKLQDAQMDADL